MASSTPHRAAQLRQVDQGFKEQNLIKGRQAVFEQLEQRVRVSLVATGQSIEIHITPQKTTAREG